MHLLDGMGREAMVASDAALLASGTAALEVCWRNADGGGVSDETLYLLAGEAPGKDPTMFRCLICWREEN